MDFRADAISVFDELSRYRRESEAGVGAVVDLAPMKDLVERLELRARVERGGLHGDELVRFLREYLGATARLRHPGSLAHQVAVPHPIGSLASLVGTFTNNPMAIYEMGPGAVAIECFVVNWLLERIGWRPAPYSAEGGKPGEHGGGVLTHGGSLANLTALVAARTRLIPDVWEQGAPGDLALLVSTESHYSISRSAGILGIGARSVYPLELGPDGTILPERVPPLLERVAADGRRPLAVVANACSTGLGRYDPLRQLGELCRARGIWFHVDGAHGASALLSPRHRGLLDGLELADSVTWDAHKLMQTPGLCTALLVRDSSTLDGAFHQQASYLFHDKAQLGVDLVHRTVECTKTDLGLRLFAVLAALGEQGMAEHVDRQFAIAHRAYELLSGLPDFECALEPQCNILCFRIRGGDELQLAIRDGLLAEGSFHLSTAVFRDRRYLRAVFTSSSTELAHVELLVARVRALAAAIGP